MLTWLRASIISAETAVIDSGVSCTLCSRNCAVTMTSSRAISWSAADSAVAPVSRLRPIAMRTAAETVRNWPSGARVIVMFG